MNVKDRFLNTLRGERPDRLPVTTHHIMPYFLRMYYNNKTYQEFFQVMGIDPVGWIINFSPDLSRWEYYDPGNTHKEVDRCFKEAGQDGGNILSPSDHFFDADLQIIKVFAYQAKHCEY